MKTILLKMHKRPRQLNQTLVEGPIWPPLGQPQLLQHLMSLEKEMAVKTVEKREIMRIHSLTEVRPEHGGNFFAFVAHGQNIPESK